MKEMEFYISLSIKFMKKTEFIEKMPLNFYPRFHEGNQIYTPKNISFSL